MEIVKRYLRRIQNIYDGVPLLPGDVKEYYDDDVISFFIHCYHIRDWIIHLEEFDILASEVRDFIDRNRPLCICADLANGSKHYLLTRKKRTEDQPHISGRERYTSAYGDEVRIMKCKYRVMSNKQTFDALDLAKECVSLWDRFISDIQEGQVN